MSKREANDSPQERASRIARKVDRLFVRNRDYFLSHVETFKQEAGRKKRVRDKDDEQPHAVEDWRPGPNPTPAAMVTLLAALHDECLPDSPAILDQASGKPRSVAQAQDPGLRALYGARVWCVWVQQEAKDAEQPHVVTDRLNTLETYLNRARADIEAAERARRERDEKTAEGGKGEAAAVVGGTWKRLRIAFVLVSLIVPVLLVGSGAWYWGEGDNLWQKCLKSWPFFALLPGFWAIALRVILGREIWLHLKFWKGDEK